MIDTIKENIIFKNKYLELKNNLVGTNGNIVFEHIKIKDGNGGGVIIIVEKDSQYLLLKSYRYGINKFIWEFPRGYQKDNETVVQSATRELKEETNITNINFVKKIGYFYPNSSIMENKINVVIVNVSSSKNNIFLEKSEFITDCKFVELKDIKTKDGMTLIALQYLQKYKEKQQYILNKIDDITRNIDCIPITDIDSLNKAKPKLTEVKIKKIQKLLKKIYN